MEDLAGTGRECRHTRGRAAISRSHLCSRSFPGFPNCQPCHRQEQTHVLDVVSQEKMEVEGYFGDRVTPCAAALRAEPVMGSTCKHTAQLRFWNLLPWNNCVLTWNTLSTPAATQTAAFNLKPCFTPASSGLVAGLEMLSKKKKKKTSGRSCFPCVMGNTKQESKLPFQATKGLLNKGLCEETGEYLNRFQGQAVSCYSINVSGNTEPALL